MKAKPTKVPMGGNVWFLFAGLLLGGATVSVAFIDAIADMVREGTGESRAKGKKKEARKEASHETVSAIETPVATPVIEEAAPPAVLVPSDAARIDLTGPDGKGTLQSIQEGVSSQSDALRECWVPRFELNPDIASTWQLKLTVEADGRVSTTALLAQDGMEDPAVTACIVQRVQSWEFGEVGSKLQVNRSIRF